MLQKILYLTCYNIDKIVTSAILSIQTDIITSDIIKVSQQLDFKSNETCDSEIFFACIAILL